MTSELKKYAFTHWCTSNLFGQWSYETNIDCFLFKAWVKLFPINDLKTMTMPIIMVLRSSWGKIVTVSWIAVNIWIILTTHKLYQRVRWGSEGQSLRLKMGECNLNSSCGHSVLVSVWSIIDRSPDYKMHKWDWKNIKGPHTQSILLSIHVTLYKLLIVYEQYWCKNPLLKYWYQ